MINILMSGCTGHMGHVISRLAENRNDIQIIAGYDINTESNFSYPIYTDLYEINEKIDVIVDFSHPAALNKLLDYCKSTKTPLVMATTGLSQEQKDLLYESSNITPIFFSANMSLGVNLLMDLVKKAAALLEESFDIEIIEKHHNQKIDAPSGTALAIADSINTVLSQKYKYVYDRHSTRSKRTKDEIGIHAMRGGTIAGEHSVIFAGNDEIIEVKHSAVSKEVFAVGALKAAKFMYEKPIGMYDMDSMLKEL